MKAMVLAAGKGSRLLPLTYQIPKPLIPVAGKPIMQHAFELLARSGVKEVCVNVCHLADDILRMYRKEKPSVGGMKIHFTREDRLMGTAGGVRRVSERFDDTFCVVMGDVLTDLDLRELVSFHKERGAIATLALKRVADASQYGVVKLDSAKNIVSFQEKPDPEIAESDLANIGIYVLEPEALEYIPEETFFDFAEDLFPKLLNAKEKFVSYEGDFYWSDIGSFSTYRTAQKDVLFGEVRAQAAGECKSDNLWMDKGAWLHPDATLEGRAAVGEMSVVGSEVTLAGTVAIGSNCWVQAGAKIVNSILLADSRVGEGAHLEDCIVGPGYQVRPGDNVRGAILMSPQESIAPHGRHREHTNSEKICQVADVFGSTVA